MKAIEDFDAALPILLRKKPDVLVVTGDHSTPCALKGHSWHSAAGAASLGMQRLGPSWSASRKPARTSLARRDGGEVF